MRKGSDIIGKPVFAYDTGKQLDNRIEDLIFDQHSNQILGFLVDERGWFSDAHILPLANVQSIGPDAVVVPSDAAIINATERDRINHILNQDLVLKGSTIMTVGGQKLGQMVDLYFNEQSGLIEGYEASGGLFADAYSGRSFIPAPKTFKIGEDVVFVPDETSDLMEEQVGGVKGVVQTANSTVKDVAQTTGDRIQAVTQAAQSNLESAQQTAAVAIDQAQRSMNTSITNIVITPEEQRRFVAGRDVQETLTLQDGSVIIQEGETVTLTHINEAEAHDVLSQLYRIAGGDVTEQAIQKTRDKTDQASRVIRSNLEKTGQAVKDSTEEAQTAWAEQRQLLASNAQDTVAEYTVDETKGRRVQRFVRTDDSAIIAAPGQIVTDHVIEQAKKWHQEHELMKAVGLSIDDAVKTQTAGALSQTGDRIQQTTQTLGTQLQEHAEQLQSNTKSLWEDVKGAASHIQSKSARALEEQRIKGALGRPVNRVILDQSDHVILNTGDLITHTSISDAREAGVLDILLDSIYTGDPKLTADSLRAKESGKASLQSSRN